MTSLMAQLPLGLGLRDDARFEHFYPGQNAGLLTYLTNLFNQNIHVCYLWGKTSSGRTHLLQAACFEANAKGRSALYLDCNDLNALVPQFLEGLETLDLVCLDNVEALSCEKEWQEAVFHLYNRMQISGAYLLVAAEYSPTQLSVLADLQSRLAWGLVYQLHELNDDEKIAALQLRAKVRGLALSEEVGRFLIKRCERHMGELFDILNDLDRASLSAQRKLTIPFVKAVLGL